MVNSELEIKLKIDSSTGTNILSSNHEFYTTDITIIYRYSKGLSMYLHETLKYINPSIIIEL